LVSNTWGFVQMLNWFSRQEKEFRIFKTYLSMRYSSVKHQYEFVLSNHIPLPFVDNLDYFPHWIEISINPIEAKAVGYNPHLVDYQYLNLPSIPASAIRIISSDLALQLDQLPVKEARIEKSQVHISIQNAIKDRSPKFLSIHLNNFFESLECIGRFKGVGKYPCSIANFWYYQDAFFMLFDDRSFPIEHSLITEMYSLFRIS
jgi:hypothetical protein